MMERQHLCLLYFRFWRRKLNTKEFLEGQVVAVRHEDKGQRRWFVHGSSLSKDKCEPTILKHLRMSKTVSCLILLVPGNIENMQDRVTSGPGHT